MVSKGRHPSKVIADALSRLDGQTFTIETIHKGHRWGRVVCRGCGQDVPIFSTPRVPEDNAELIARFARNHADHRPIDTEEES